MPQALGHRAAVSLAASEDPGPSAFAGAPLEEGFFDVFICSSCSFLSVVLVLLLTLFMPSFALVSHIIPWPLVRFLSPVSVTLSFLIAYLFIYFYVHFYSSHFGISHCTCLCFHASFRLAHSLTFLSPFVLCLAFISYSYVLHPFLHLFSGLYL